MLKQDKLALTALQKLPLLVGDTVNTVENCTLLIKPLEQLSHDVRSFEQEYHQVRQLALECQLESSIKYQMPGENDIVLEVYHQGCLAGVATFSRYLDDPKRLVNHSDLFYEVVLHTIYVSEPYRGIGLATYLAATIVEVARLDCEHLHRCLAVHDKSLKLWFSALAISEGGEVICDYLSEAFVEMSDDLIDELQDDGINIKYHEPMIFVDSLQ
ncbi:N-acetyltransferase [Photobacterium sanctipauli]|uniref:N-acetyltransferase n=1 Tax=Photobacterium sanctipauli TaxID=1342794 RepID=A0A2T3NPL6_9GAMM|nr:GNAT family N-acetyltransferase [Photobacterium sanctipauli]PSW18213.1 N-acetyltransferase [Photobacterium sanctipauli]